MLFRLYTHYQIDMYQIDAVELISEMRPASLYIPEQYVLDGRTGALVRFHEGDFINWPASVNNGR